MELFIIAILFFAFYFFMELIKLVLDTFEKNIPETLNKRGKQALILAIFFGLLNNFSSSISVESLRQSLFGENSEIEIVTNKNCIAGRAEGRLVGGNLSIIYSLGGTLFDLNAKESILFIEDKIGRAHV